MTYCRTLEKCSSIPSLRPLRHPHRYLSSAMAWNRKNLPTRRENGNAQILPHRRLEDSKNKQFGYLQRQTLLSIFLAKLSWPVTAKAASNIGTPRSSITSLQNQRNKCPSIRSSGWTPPRGKYRVAGFGLYKRMVLLRAGYVASKCSSCKSLMSLSAR